ncbi:MAG: DUF2188 domain-containing protein [Candidatus Altimarinota bacterium]
MSKRKVVHVVPNDGDWAVKVNGKIVSNHHLKQRALDNGKKVAKSSDLGQLVIHKGNGTIQTEHTFGSDPNPPRG